MKTQSVPKRANRVTTAGWLILGLMGIVVLAGGLTSCASTPQAQVEDPDSWQLVWSDEFEYTGSPDPEKWFHEVLPPGAYNRELQAYTNKEANSRVEDGKLIIQAHPIPGTQRGYTSARITTRISHHMYLGRIEVRAKLPDALGSWPAIWMLPVSTVGRTGWPHSGEIDIMEHVGYETGVVHSSVHTSKYNWPNGNHHTATIDVPEVAQAFHTYAMEWTEDYLDFFVDDQLITRYENEGSGWEAWPFDVPFYLILNVAVGGEWGGAQGVNRNDYPDQMEVEWVRIFARR